MRSIYWQIPVLLLAIAGLYFPFVGNPYVFDDLTFFNPDIQGNAPELDHHFSFFELRSLPYASFAWTGVEITKMRVGNLLLHAATVLALLFLIRRLATETIGGVGEGGKHVVDSTAFVAALLFAVHPVAVYAVGYLVQRSIVMATLFSLLSMLSYLHGSTSGKRAWLWASVFFYFWAVFSKEHVILLPAVLVALTILLHEDWLVQLKRRAIHFIAMAVIALFVVAAHRGLIGSIYEPGAAMLLGDLELAYPLSVLTQSWLFFKYILLWMCPNPAWMSVDMREPFAQSLLSPYLLSFLVFLLWGGGAAWLLFRRGSQGLLGFGMLFVWLMFMTEMSTVRIQESFVLYRSYPWAAGLFCLSPLMAIRFNRVLGWTLIAAVSITMFVISMERLSTFSHVVLLWEDAAKLVKEREDLPGAARIHFNLGTDLTGIREYEKAIVELKHAIRLAPDFMGAYGNLGVVYYKQQRWELAAESFSQAIETAYRIKTPSPPAKMFYVRALAYESMGKMELARQDYAVACKVENKWCAQPVDSGKNNAK